MANKLSEVDIAGVVNGIKDKRQNKKEQKNTTQQQKGKKKQRKKNGKASQRYSRKT